MIERLRGWRWEKKKYLREYSELHDCSWFEWPCRLTKRKLIPEAALVQRGNVDGRLLPRARSREEWISCVEGTESTPLQTRRLCTLECRVGFPLLSIYIWLSHSHSASNHPWPNPSTYRACDISFSIIRTRNSAISMLIVRIHGISNNISSNNPGLISFYPFTRRENRFSFE